MTWRGKYTGSSFSELLKIDYPELSSPLSVQPLPAIDRGRAPAIPEGTTVLAIRYADGVLVAGDRLATAEYRVASREVQKVYPTDAHSLIAIAGAAGPCIEMANLLRIELEHYEKIEGSALELEGKANKLSQMIRSNLPAALQGLVVIPIFAGYDERRRTGRIWKYDVTGGRTEEKAYDATGSGMLFARESIKSAYRPDGTRAEAVRMAVAALTDAADEDRGTGGVDLVRGIFPNLNVCTAAGVGEVPREEIEAAWRAVIDERRAREDAS